MIVLKQQNFHSVDSSLASEQLNDITAFIDWHLSNFFWQASHAMDKIALPVFFGDIILRALFVHAHGAGAESYFALK